MPVQLYAIQQSPKSPAPNVDRLRAELTGLVHRLRAEMTETLQQATASLIPTMRSEMHEIECNLMTEMGAVAATVVSSTSPTEFFEQTLSKLNELHARLQLLEAQVQQVEKNGRKRPAPLQRLVPALPLTTTESHKGYHEPTVASLRGAAAPK